MPPPPPDDAAELIAWKSAGAAAWYTALFALGAAAWHLAAAPGSPLPWRLLSFSGLARLLALYATSLAVLYAQRRLLASTDVPPIHAPRLGLTGRTWGGAFAARCLLRRRTARDVIGLAALYGACALSGCVGVAALSGAAAKVGGASWLVLYGTTLGLTYAVAYLVRAQNVLAYPIVQRARYFRMKQRLPAAARTALVLPTIAAAIAAAAPLLFPSAWRAGGGAPPLPPPPPLSVTLAAWRAGALCAFAWAAAAAALEVVFTEPVAFGGASDGNRPLLAALKHPDPLVADWALADLAAVAEAPPGAAGAARRAALFADDTGASGWVPVVSFCLAEVAGLTGSLAAAAGAAAAPAAGGGGGGGGGGPRWNAALASKLRGKGGAVGPPKEEVAAEWAVRSRYRRASLALRALAGVAAASLTEDTFGVAQLSSPGLGDAAVGLLAASVVARQHVKAAAAASMLRPRPAGGHGPLAALLRSAGLPAPPPGPRPGAGGAAIDPAAAALLDASQTACYRVTNAFGPVLRGVVREAAAAAAKKGLPGAAGAGDALEAFLKFEE